MGLSAKSTLRGLFFRGFSSSPLISPLQFTRGAKPSLNPNFSDPRRPENGVQTTPKGPKTIKYLSHSDVVRLITEEQDLQKSLDIFNNAAKQQGFYHNFTTYNVLINKLGRAKKFQAIEGILTQMSMLGCRCHESLFTNLMKLYCRACMPEKSKEIFYRMRLFNCKPSMSALSTLLNLFVEAGRLDLAEEVFADLRNLRLVPNACIFNIFI